jgi:hypothetical protein
MQALDQQHREQVSLPGTDVELTTMKERERTYDLNPCGIDAFDLGRPNQRINFLTSLPYVPNHLGGFRGLLRRGSRR